MPTFGLNGAVGPAEYAVLSSHYGADYGVLGAGDWRVTPVAGADRTVRIAAGTGYGHGAIDVDTAEATLAGGVVGSGSRWDTVVRRRIWGDPGSSEFTILQGTATQAISADRLNNPGIQDDQPIALVQFSSQSTMPVQIIDLRCWHGNAGLLAATTDALFYLSGRLGTRVHINSMRSDLIRRLDAQQNPVWDAPSPGAWTPQSAAQASASNIVIPSGALGLTKAVEVAATDQHRVVDLTFGALPVAVSAGASLDVFVRVGGSLAGITGVDLPRRVRTRRANESVNGSYSVYLGPNVTSTFQLIGAVTGGSVTVTPDIKFTHLDVNIRGS